MISDESIASPALRHFAGPYETIYSFVKMMYGMFGLRKLEKGGRIDPILAEKVMLAVVGVNECEFCSYNHTVIALERGIRQDEIESLLAGDTNSLSPDEVPAVLYAQHWADSKGHVLLTARGKIVEYYGNQKVLHIEALIRLSEFTNLCNNTVIVYQSTKNRKGFRLFFAYLLCYPLHIIMKRRYNKNRKAERTI
jgi:AhpD family alkylhydroperoxidase